MSESEQARMEAPAPGERIALPGARAVDHCGFVVPDLGQAVSFFRDLLGAAVLWTAAPVKEPAMDMEAVFGAAPGARPRLAMLRLGPNLNLELVQYDVTDDRRTVPSASDLGVGHLGIIVEDIDRAGRRLTELGVKALQVPRSNASGPNQGQRSWFFRTPWGMFLELVERPSAMPYEAEASARLFVEHDVASR